MHITNTEAPLGAEINGLDLTQPLDAATFAQLEDLFHERSVLVFRAQHLTDEHHLAFARRFGELEIHVAKQYLKPGCPELLILSNVIEADRSIGMQDAGQYWHTDLSYVAVPSRCSLLYALEVPVQENGIALGETLFVSTTYAYDTLAEEMKARLAGLRAIHRYGDRYQKMSQTTGGRTALSAEALQQVPDVVHPVIRTHPATGRKCLYVNEGFTVALEGLPADESAALLQELYPHIVRPASIHRHQWRVGDLLMWDNCATQHCAVANYALPLRRRMQRATVRGSAPY